MNFKGSETASIVSIDVTDCTQLPCVFVRGKNYTLDLKFTSSMWQKLKIKNPASSYNYWIFIIEVDSKAATNKVYGIIAKVPVPFHLPNNDGCTLGINCPFKSGLTLTESVTLPVLSEYPKV